MIVAAMEIQRLRYFTALVREKGFARAATAMRVSQPTLSQQIALLERELGVSLVRRLRGGVTPTEAGRGFLKRATNILAELDYAAQEAAAHAGRLRGVLRLGAIPTVAPYVLPDLVATFAKAHPGVTVEARESVTERLEQLLQSGEIDGALVALPIRSENLKRVVLREEQLFVAVPAGHAALDSGGMRWKDIGDESWLMLEESHCLGVQTRELCSAKGLSPKVALRGSQIATLLEMVGRGLGVAVVPEMAGDRLPKGVKLAPFAGRKPTRTVALVMREDAYEASPALRTFADFVKGYKKG
jgi:LysR family hydrogen peroxide-inducible transcriptional activator